MLYDRSSELNENFRSSDGIVPDNRLCDRETFLRVGEILPEVTTSCGLLVRSIVILFVVVVVVVVEFGLNNFPVKEFPARCREVKLGNDHTQSGMRPMKIHVVRLWNKLIT